MEAFGTLVWKCSEINELPLWKNRGQECWETCRQQRPVKFQRKLKAPSGSFIWYFELKFCGCWSIGTEEWAVVTKRPAPLRWTLLVSTQQLLSSAGQRLHLQIGTTLCHGQDTPTWYGFESMKGWILGRGQIFTLCGRVCLRGEKPPMKVQPQLHWKHQDLRGHGEKLSHSIMREDQDLNRN